MKDATWEKSEKNLEHAKSVVADTREKLLSEGVGPHLVIFAMFHEGLAITSIEHLNSEDQLMVCDTLEKFINNTKLAIKEWRN